MVGFDSKKVALNNNEYAFAGGFASALCRGVLQPLDVIKIRLQLQVEPLNANGKYSGLFQALLCIKREEGLRALWKGHIPGQLLSVSYGSIQFLVFELYTSQVNTLISNSRYENYKTSIHTISGGLAGCTATLLTYPIDTLRTRLIAQGEPKTYHSITDAIVKIWKEGGIRCFFKGINPTLLQIFPYMALQFGFYNFFSKLLSPNKSDDEQTLVYILKSGLSGSLSGVAAKTLTYPLDFIKKRLQVQGFQEARKMLGITGKYYSSLNCMQKVIKEEGVRSVFKGLYPALLKAGLTSGCLFCVYDNFCFLLSSIKEGQSDS